MSIQSISLTLYDCYFSNGIKYIHSVDREHYLGLTKQPYHTRFTNRDWLLDAAISKGDGLQCGSNLWRVYDDAVSNYSLTPVGPYEWLFKYALFNDKSIVISKPNDKILLLNGVMHIDYYDFIHGRDAFFQRYGRAVD